MSHDGLGIQEYNVEATSIEGPRSLLALATKTFLQIYSSARPIIDEFRTMTEQR
jgi:hypothetical protein